VGSSDACHEPGRSRSCRARYHQDVTRKTTVDDVCVAYAGKGAKITVKPLREDSSVILFEGDQLAFEFLGNLFMAQAKAVNGCGFEIGLKYAGHALFSTKAKLGLYLHRLPCDSPAKRERRASKMNLSTHN